MTLITSGSQDRRCLPGPSEAGIWTSASWEKSIPFDCTSTHISWRRYFLVITPGLFNHGYDRGSLRAHNLSLFVVWIINTFI